MTKSDFPQVHDDSLDSSAVDIEMGPRLPQPVFENMDKLILTSPIKKPKRTTKTKTKSNTTKKKKTKTKTKEKEWNIIPQQIDLINTLKASYNSKSKERILLPLIQFVEWQNRNGGNIEWLLPLIESDELLSIFSFFFYGKETIPILLEAVVGPTQLDAISSAARDNDSEAVMPLPGFLLFKNKLADAPIEIENQKRFKSLLLNAIKRSININGNGDPVVDLLLETNERLGKIGWLFNLGSKKKRVCSRSYSNKFLATALYSILGGGCNLDYCATLATALGSKATSVEKKRLGYNTLLVILQTKLQNLKK